MSLDINVNDIKNFRTILRFVMKSQIEIILEIMKGGVKIICTNNIQTSLTHIAISKKFFTKYIVEPISIKINLKHMIDILKHFKNNVRISNNSQLYINRITESLLVPDLSRIIFDYMSADMLFLEDDVNACILEYKIEKQTLVFNHILVFAKHTVSMDDFCNIIRKLQDDVYNISSDDKRIEIWNSDCSTNYIIKSNTKTNDRITNMYKCNLLKIILALQKKVQKITICMRNQYPLLLSIALVKHIYIIVGIMPTI